MSWTLASNLDESTTYYWFVASRVRGEQEPIVQSTKKRGWILSQAFSFKTVTGPPPTPTGATAGNPGKGRGGHGRDFLGLGRE